MRRIGPYTLRKFLLSTQVSFTNKKLSFACGDLWLASQNWPLFHGYYSIGYSRYEWQLKLCDFSFIITTNIIVVVKLNFFTIQCARTSAHKSTLHKATLLLIRNFRVSTSKCVMSMGLARVAYASYLVKVMCKWISQVTFRCVIGLKLIKQLLWLSNYF